MKKRLIFFLFIILIIHNSCKKTYVQSDADLVINELMPVNSTVVADQNGEYDDWIELYNLSSDVRDISGYFLSDNKKHISKWQFPAGTTIEGNGYLIIWADSDTSQTGLHANFKLSSLGEELILSKPDGSSIDKVIYPGQSLELTYSRNPNGTGEFKWQNPTFGKTNDYKK